MRFHGDVKNTKIHHNYLFSIIVVEIVMKFFREPVDIEKYFVLFRQIQYLIDQLLDAVPVYNWSLNFAPFDSRFLPLVSKLITWSLANTKTRANFMVCQIVGI